MERTNHWQSRKLTQAFLEQARCAIPAADLQFAIIDRIVKCWCHRPKRILDLGCGDGIMGRYLLNAYPNASGWFIDKSDPMLEAARTNLKKTPNVTVSKGDFSGQDRRDNILAPVEEQCRWLRRIGFTDVDCFFKAFELAIFGGRRLANARPNESVS